VSAKTMKAKNTEKPGKAFGSGGVFYTFPQGEGGQIHITIDFSQVPSPPSYYYADSMHLRLDEEHGMSVLSFGRRIGNTDKFSDRIDVVMPTKSLIGPFWKSTRPVEPTLDKLLEASKLTGETRPMSPPEGLAATLFANTIFAAVGEGESTLDFYHLSPREVHLAKSQKANMQLEPTIRVIMSTVLTKHFFNMLRPYAEGRSDSAPVLERSQHALRSR
jgi:hypothetical protein